MDVAELGASWLERLALLGGQRSEFTSSRNVLWGNSQHPEGGDSLGSAGVREGTAHRAHAGDTWAMLVCQRVCARVWWGDSSAKAPGRKEEGVCARWAGGARHGAFRPADGLAKQTLRDEDT